MYERTKEYKNANHKFDTSVVFAFLGDEKELILCCVNRGRQELLAKIQNTSNKNENTKTICV